MQILSLQQYLVHNFSEEIAEEFGIYRPSIERDITATKPPKKVDKGGAKSEKETKVRTESTNSSR